MDLHHYFEKRLNYEFHLREGTQNEMSTEEYDRKLDNFKRMKINVQFLPDRDTKFRYSANKFRLLWTYNEMVIRVLNDNLHVKEHIFGAGSEDFKWSESFLQQMRKFMVHHHQQVIINEKDSEMDDNSVWTLVEANLDYTMCIKDENQLPLSDPFQL